MKKDYTGKYFKAFYGYCYNFFIYGHRCNECKKPRFNNGMHENTNLATSKPLGTINVLRNGIMC